MKKLTVEEIKETFKVCTIRQCLKGIVVKINKQIDLSIDLNISKFKEKVDKLKQGIKKYQTFLKKLNHKKKNSLMVQLANGQIIDRKQKLETLQKKEIIFEKAKKLIKDYDYDIVEEVELVIRSAMNSMNTSSTSWG